MGMTIIEKILAKASGAARIVPGDLAVVDVDLVVMIDLSFSRASWREVLKVHDPDKVVVGKKGRSSLRFRRYDVDQAWTDFTDRPAYSDAAAIANKLAELYTEREVDRVVIVYNHYESALTQRVVVEDMLPIPRTALEDEEEKTPYEIALEGDFIYEPEPEDILKRLLPTYLETSIYRALLESAASEHGARMTAMRNASKNAGELIDRLTLDMNRARQAEITQEILEVVAGADALTQ